MTAYNPSPGKVSRYNFNENSHYEARGDKENGQMGLTFTILALIFMQNNKVATIYMYLCLSE